MRAILVLLLACAPAGALGQAEAVYGDPDALRGDVIRAFALASERTQTPAQLSFDAGPDCDFVASAAAAEFLPGRVDVIYVCSKIRHSAANFEQLFFVLGHEFAHLKRRHMAALVDAWEKAEPVPLWASAPMDKFRLASESTHPAVARARQAIELEADQDAADLLVREGMHPAHGAFVCDRALAYFGRLHGAPEPWLRQGQERIGRIMDRVPEHVRRLPSRPVEGFFP